MTDCPSIPSTAHRLLRPNRPGHLVRSDRRSRAKGASRIRFGSNPGQILRQSVAVSVFITQTNASVAVTEPAGSPLSP
jgi:hypothetical protein